MRTVFTEARRKICQNTGFLRQETHQPSAHHLVYVFPDSRTIVPEENYPNPNSKPSPKPSPNPNRGEQFSSGKLSGQRVSHFLSFS